MSKDKSNEIKLKGGSRATTLVGVLLILVVIAGYVFYTKPLLDDYSQNNEDLDNKIAEETRLENRLLNLEAAEVELESVNELQGLEIDNKIPLEMQQNRVIEDVINVSQDNGIGLRSISFGRGASSQEGIASLRVNASFEGDYGDLIDFLENLERNSRFFRVNSISVQLASSDIIGIERATFSLAMEAFYREEVASVDSTDLENNET